MPRAPRKCNHTGCTRRVRGSSYCDEHRPVWQGAGIGRTRAERALAHQVLREEPICRDCGAPSTVAGHIVPKAYGGQYTRSNLKGQCEPCNNRQIVTDRRHYAQSHDAGKMGANPVAPNGRSIPPIGTAPGHPPSPRPGTDRDSHC